MISITEYLNQGQTILSNYILANYRRLGMDHEEFVFWLQLYRYHEQGNDFPDLSMIANEMQIKQEEVFRLLGQLIEKQLLTIETVKRPDGKQVDFYRFDSIFAKLEALAKTEQRKNQAAEKEETISSLYKSIEQEFGRPLSPIEYERIGQWLNEDKYQPELILLALKEAVLNQVYNLNYIDRVLLSWERKNITTSHQVTEEQQRRKRQLLQKEAETANEKKRELPKISLHNWLDGDDHDK